MRSEHYKDHYIEYWYCINESGCFVYHREDGPAMITYNLYDPSKLQSVYYQQNGKPHRLDGPAFITYDDNGEIYKETHFVLNFHITEKEFNTPGFVD